MHLTNVIILTAISASVAIQAQSLAPPIVFKSGLMPHSDSWSMVTLSNSSAKTIVAYVLKLEDVDSKGNPLFKASEMRIFGLEPPPVPEGKASGEQWIHKSKVYNKPGSVPSKLTIDYVLFADNSAWGKDSLGLSAKIKGVQEGWRGANTLSKQVLQREGSAGLTNYLGRIK